MRLPTLGPKSLAVIGVILCFLIAFFFSGCSLDDFVGDLTGTKECVFYPECPGTYQIIYHDSSDPPGTFKSGMFRNDFGEPYSLFNPTDVEKDFPCDGIESSSRVGAKCPPQ